MSSSCGGPAGDSTTLIPVIDMFNHAHDGCNTLHAIPSAQQHPPEILHYGVLVQDRPYAPVSRRLGARLRGTLFSLLSRITSLLQGEEVFIAYQRPAHNADLLCNAELYMA